MKPLLKMKIVLILRNPYCLFYQQDHLIFGTCKLLWWWGWLCYLFPKYIKFFTLFYLDAVWVGGRSLLDSSFCITNWLVRVVIICGMTIYVSFVLYGILISVQFCCFIKFITNMFRKRLVSCSITIKVFGSPLQAEVTISKLTEERSSSIQDIRV